MVCPRNRRTTSLDKKALLSGLFVPEFVPPQRHHSSAGRREEIRNMMNEAKMNELTQAEDMVSASQSSKGMALPMPNKEA